MLSLKVYRPKAYTKKCGKKCKKYEQDFVLFCFEQDFAIISHFTQHGDSLVLLASGIFLSLLYHPNPQ